MISFLYQIVVLADLLQPWVIFFCCLFKSPNSKAFQTNNNEKFPSSSLVFFSYLDRGVHRTPGTWFTHPKYPCLQIIPSIQTMPFENHRVFNQNTRCIYDILQPKVLIFTLKVILIANLYLKPNNSIWGARDVGPAQSTYLDSQQTRQQSVHCLMMIKSIGWQFVCIHLDK